MHCCEKCRDSFLRKTKTTQSLLQISHKSNYSQQNGTRQEKQLTLGGVFTTFQRRQKNLDLVGKHLKLNQFSEKRPTKTQINVIF